MFTADLLERAVKTFLQAFVVTFGGLLAVPATVTDVGAWRAAGLAALAGALSAGLSAVTSLLSKPIGDKSTASIVTEPKITLPAAQVGVAPLTPAVPSGLIDGSTLPGYGTDHDTAPVRAADHPS